MSVGRWYREVVDTDGANGADQPVAVPAATRARIEQVLAGLDYRALGDIYCDEGGEAFWADRRGPVRELGLDWAAAVIARLPRGGDSLYAGAGVAELPALIAEVLERERRCLATTLRQDEAAVLNAALAGAGLGDRLAVRAADARDVVGEGPFDHLSLVSVLDDPQTFPAVSAVTYGRAVPWTLDAAAFEHERAQVRALVAALVAALRRPALVTTTVEEAGWLLERAEAVGVPVRGEDVALDTALVGDPIGFLWWGQDG